MAKQYASIKDSRYEPVLGVLVSERRDQSLITLDRSQQNEFYGTGTINNKHNYFFAFCSVSSHFAYYGFLRQHFFQKIC